MHKKIDQKLVIVISLLVVIPLFTLITRNFQPKNTPTNSIPATVATQNLTLMLDFGNQPLASFTTPFTASESAFSLLQKIAGQQNLPLSFKKYSFGTLVDGINSYSNSSDKAWVYYVNGQSPTVGAADYLLAPGDKVEWKYVKPQ